MAGDFGGWRHRASQFYFLILFFSFPLFSIPCQKGTCVSPMEIVAASLLSNGVDEGVVKALLYPGSVFSKLEGIVADNEAFSFPDWKTLLKDMKMVVDDSNAKEERSVPKVGIVIGSSLCIIGAVFALFGLMYVSACGMLTLLWYIFTLGGEDSNVYASPMFALAMFCALSGVFSMKFPIKREEPGNQPQRATTVGKAKKAKLTSKACTECEGLCIRSVGMQSPHINGNQHMDFTRRTQISEEEADALKKFKAYSITSWYSLKPALCTL